jgi:hypothetical protein
VIKFPTNQNHSQSLSISFTPNGLGMKGHGLRAPLVTKELRRDWMELREK